MNYKDPCWETLEGEYANCYAFACNICGNFPNTNLAPGDLQKLSPDNINCRRKSVEEIKISCVKDGLIAIEDASLCPEGHYPIALMLYYNEKTDRFPYDFHFFRLEYDENNQSRWASKCVGSAPTLEEKNFCPKNGVRWDYRQYDFAGFFAVPSICFMPNHLLWNYPHLVEHIKLLSGKDHEL